MLKFMNLTAQIKLIPSIEQAQKLLVTLRAFNSAANYAVGEAFRLGCTNKIELQKHVYRQVRDQFGLPADMTVRVIAQAVEALKRDKSILPVFRELAGIPYSHGKQYGFKGIDRVSMQVAPLGREVMPFVCGAYQKQQLKSQRGQADLVYRDGQFFLHVTIDFPDVEAKAVSDFIGLDLGIVNIVTDSNGGAHSGERDEQKRRRANRARQTYQHRNTKNAKRRLKKLAGRQARFQRDVNHVIAKKVVSQAKALDVGIAMEDLSGIRDRLETTADKSLRKRLGNWGFFQLRQFVTYKAQLAGVATVFVDPRNTSRTCNQCGYCDKKNRKSQSQFVCLRCSHACNADHNGALNIRSIALGVSVNNPHLAADKR